MQVEISEQIYEALSRQAEEHDLTVSDCLERIVQDHMNLSSRRKQAVKGITAFIKTNTATSGRGSMDWREYIHQGHRY